MNYVIDATVTIGPALRDILVGFLVFVLVAPALAFGVFALLTRRRD